MLLSRERSPRKGAPEPPPQEARLGARLAVIGEINSEDPVVVCGWVQGYITAPTVTVAPGGRIDGTVMAQAVRIGGVVFGKIDAALVVVQAAAEVHGTVLHHDLRIDPAGWVDGSRPWRPINYFTDRLPAGAAITDIAI